MKSYAQTGLPNRLRAASVWSIQRTRACVSVQRLSTAGSMQRHNSAIPVAAIYAAPTKAGGGKAGMARAGACFPGVLISAAARGLWNSEPALVTGKPTLSVPPKEKQPLLSCTERKSRFLLLARVQDKTAASFNAALIPCLRAVPPKLRQTLTLDNGSEMAGFRALERATGLRTYFCKPHAPWQRGTNENSNGLLRQYFPRGISFHKITEAMVVKAAEQLNNRPRKCLHYQTPTEVFNQALTGAFAI
ncbi:hypothetical protein CAY53_11375 [Desulfobulbus oralis]|uniref:Integrase catalytic domain-containing protein n=1 Tax=Desulfobulbus oralis TaxID=1986146 RepID=A0A2L1GRM4_9BACT|nr:hypothetical protein CAY53_11375 [Desulfobulbus oralis]